MRSTYILLPLLLASHLAWSQTPPPAAPASAPAQRSARPAIDTRTERIRVEDTDARIDEVRIGGRTQSIEVQPKSSMPAYQVAPETGERSWKVLGF